MAVTIKDVSAKCGLSISTVSKAFNNYADISLETRELVQRTAQLFQSTKPFLDYINRGIAFAKGEYQN